MDSLKVLEARKKSLLRLLPVMLLLVLVSCGYYGYFVYQELQARPDENAAIQTLSSYSAEPLPTTGYGYIPDGIVCGAYAYIGDDQEEEVSEYSLMVYFTDADDNPVMVSMTVTPEDSVWDKCQKYAKYGNNFGVLHFPMYGSLSALTNADQTVDFFHEGISDFAAYENVSAQAVPVNLTFFSDTEEGFHAAAADALAVSNRKLLAGVLILAMLLVSVPVFVGLVFRVNRRIDTLKRQNTPEL